jgi:hypothetical protein
LVECRTNPAGCRSTRKENSEINTAAQVEHPKKGLVTFLSAAFFAGARGAFFLQHCMQPFFADAASFTVPTAGKSDNSITQQANIRANIFILLIFRQ